MYTLTRKQALMATAGASATLTLGRFASRASAADSPAFGAPPELAGLTFPEPRIYQETQGWWLQGNTALSAPGEMFPHDSTHVHLGIPFPTGEQLDIPSSGGYSWPYLAQFHNGQGGNVRQVRGGGFQTGSCCPTDPSYKGVAINTQDQRHAGAIVIPASVVSQWRAMIGKRENRFTADTTSKFGKRQYQSGAWNTWMNQSGAPVGITARGWYEGPGYTNITLKDSNLGSGTGFRASTVRSTAVPNPWVVTWSLAQGAAWFFAYVNADIHGGTKGTVIAENVKASSGSISIPASATHSGVNVLLVGGWEKSSTGWNAGVLRIPFLGA